MGSFSIKNKVIVITGATGYLGNAMVELLHNAGAKVLLLSTDMSKVKKLCKDLKIDENQGFIIDIGSKISVDQTFKEIINRFGKVDVLVNNAYFGVSTSFFDTNEEEWIKAFDGSVMGIDRCTKAVIPQMKEQGFGRIINISSMYGMVVPNPDIYPDKNMINPIAYGVGKAGIIQYSKYLAMLLADDNILVNSVSYGPFPNIDNIKDKAFLQNLADKTFLKRVGVPKEAVSAIYFLSLDESSYITGQNIVVDGGWTSW